MSNQSFDVSGIDIATELIEKCNADWPNINAKVGDAEFMPYEDDSFNFVYCVHSSWFIPDLGKAISEICRVSKVNGYFLIDLMNANNRDMDKIYKQHVFEDTNFVGQIFKAFKNAAKLILQRGTQDWPYLISQTPSDPNEIIGNCLKFGGGSIRLYSWIDSELKEISISEGDQYQNYSRMVIYCQL